MTTTLKIHPCNRCGHTPDWKWGVDVEFNPGYMVFPCPQCASSLGGSVLVVKTKNEKGWS